MTEEEILDYAHKISERAKNELEILGFTPAMHKLQQGFSSLHELSPMLHGFSDARTHKLCRTDEELNETMNLVNTNFAEKSIDAGFSLDDFKEKYLIGYWGWRTDRSETVLNHISPLSSTERQLASAIVLEGLLHANNVANRGSLTDEHMGEVNNIIEKRSTTLGVSYLMQWIPVIVAGVMRMFLTGDSNRSPINPDPFDTQSFEEWREDMALEGIEIIDLDFIIDGLPSVPGRNSSSGGGRRLDDDDLHREQY